MLEKLSIKDFAIIDELELVPRAGLNVFTGETGAGKSIVIEALGFVLGERASADLIRGGAARTAVSAVFSSDDLDRDARKTFGITGKTFTLRRELDSRGRNRAFINSSPVAVSALARAGESLVDFHGQHEHQTLLNGKTQLAFVDRYGGLEKAAAAVSAMYHELAAVRAKLEAVRLSSQEKERLLDLYRYQLAEITDAHVAVGEDAELEQLLPRVKNAGKLKALAEEAYTLLYSGEGSAEETLGKAARLAGELNALDPSVAETAQAVERLAAGLDDAAAQLASYKDSIDIDPAQLDEMLSRHEKLLRLKKKYGPELADVLDSAETLRAKIADLEGTEEKEAELQQQADKLAKQLSSACDKLHDDRFAAAKKLSARVLTEIRPLGFPDVRFSIAVEMDADSIGPDGADTVDFLFSSNPGQPLKSLRHIASGGEISRVMLGLKTVLAGADSVPVMVFDEVDAGIGGVVGRLVGAKLKKVSAGRQVFCVTHLPQVAGFGDEHFHVSKSASGGETFTKVSALSPEERVREIARMLGGSRDLSELGLSHARELITECREK